MPSAENSTASVCCIYHAPKAVDESSGESSSDSSSSSSSDSDRDGAGKKAQGEDNKGGEIGDSSRKGKRKHHHHQCDKHGRRPSRRARKDGDEGGGRLPSPNAYEKMPKPKGGGSGPGREKG